MPFRFDDFFESARTKLLGERVKSARERAGLSQEEAAAELAMHPQTLSKIERGVQKSVRADQLSRMADLFNVSERWLATGEGSPERTVSLPETGADSLQLGALLAMQRARRAIDDLMDQVIGGAALQWAQEEAARAASGAVRSAAQGRRKAAKQQMLDAVDQAPEEVEIEPGIPLEEGEAQLRKERHARQPSRRA